MENRVKVDPQLCAASAMCTRIAPSILELPDGSDWAVVLQPTVSDADQIELAREAMEACPTGAITIEEGLI